MLDQVINSLYFSHCKSLYYNQVQWRSFCATETVHKQRFPACRAAFERV